MNQTLFSTPTGYTHGLSHSRYRRSAAFCRSVRSIVVRKASPCCFRNRSLNQACQIGSRRITFPSRVQAKLAFCTQRPTELANIHPCSYEGLRVGCPEPFLEWPRTAESHSARLMMLKGLSECAGGGIRTHGGLRHRISHPEADLKFGTTLFRPTCPFDLNPALLM